MIDDEWWMGGWMDGRDGWMKGNEMNGWLVSNSSSD